MNFLALLWSWAEKLSSELQISFSFLSSINTSKLLHTETVVYSWAYFSILMQLSQWCYQQVKSIIWAAYLWLELFCAWAVFCMQLMNNTGPEDILFCRLIVHIACDLTSHCWNQLNYLTQIIMSAGCSVSVKITDFLSICGDSENRVCWWVSKLNTLFHFQGRERKKMTYFPSVDWSLDHQQYLVFYIWIKWTFFQQLPVWLPQKGFWSARWEGWLHFLLIHSVFPLASELCRGLKSKCW